MGESIEFRTVELPVPIEFVSTYCRSGTFSTLSPHPCSGCYYRLLGTEGNEGAA